MRQKMTRDGLPWLTILLHWGVGMVVLVLFFLGIWMVGLDYYHPWYYQGPWWHKGLGVVLLVWLLCQSLWQFYRVPAVSLLKRGSWQARLSTMMHVALLLLSYLLVLSGYFIVSGQGRGLAVFDWFNLPAVVELNDMAMQWFGEFHCYAAYILIFLVGLHVFAALKHHFFDKDAVLSQMLGKRRY